MLGEWEETDSPLLLQTDIQWEKGLSGSGHSSGESAVKGWPDLPGDQGGRLWRGKVFLMGPES